MFFRSGSKSAEVEFSDASSAERFTKVHNRKMVELSIITVTRLN